MVKLIKYGDYKLIETKHLTKVIFLDQRGIYAWVNAEEIGEILVSSYKQHEADYILAVGKYRLYKVTGEPVLVDTWHLELSIGGGSWQGYLLPNGLPNSVKKRTRIEPTKELITVIRTSMPTLYSE